VKGGGKDPVSFGGAGKIYDCPGWKCRRTNSQRQGDRVMERQQKLGGKKRGGFGGKKKVKIFYQGFIDEASFVGREVRRKIAANKMRQVK